MLRRITIALQLAAAATLLAITLYVRAAQNPTWAGSIRLATDHAWLFASTRALLSVELLDDRIGILSVLHGDAASLTRLATDLDTHRRQLNSIPPREDRPWSFPEAFMAVRRDRGVQVVLPLWAPATVLCLHPAIALLRGPYLRHRRRRAGRCVACGYDLTGLSGDRCPECGQPATARELRAAG